MSCSKKIKKSELFELAAWGRAELSRAGIEETQEECERILMKLFGCSRSALYLEEHTLESDLRERFLATIKKRVKRIPLAYLLGETDFWRETLSVDKRCLIPRPETEILVEQVLKSVGPDTGKAFSFLDIGTGSGAIAVALLRAYKNARGTLADISREALEVARKNIKRYSLEERAEWTQGDLFEPFPENERWDLIVSNPPYLSEKDWDGVQEELKHEPRQALDGGKDGLDYYRKIIASSASHLTPEGLLALEVGQGQAEKVSKWLQEAGYVNIQRFNDHLGIQRVLTAQKHS